MPDPIFPSSIAIYREPNTKRAAALVTVGVDFSSDKDNERTTNTYSETTPYAPGRPGSVYYLLAEKSSAGIATKKLAAAYDDASYQPSLALDALVNEISAANPALGRKLADLLPLAIVSYLRGAFENRERIQDLWKKALPMVLVRRGENSFTLVHRNASDTVLKRFGLK